MLARIARGMARTFCASKPVQQTTGSSVMESSKTNEIPVHLKPYNKAKYEVPM